MDPTTSGRFRVHDRRQRPDIDDGSGGTDAVDDGTDSSGVDGDEEFVLVELADGPVDPTDPDAEDRFDPLYATAEGYEGDLADAVEALRAGFVVDATLAWTDGSARFRDVEVVRETRFRFADEVEGMFEAAVETWQQIRAEGEPVGSITTRSNDGDPNGALYLFADAPGSDTFDEVRTGRLPIEPLVARVNESREDDDPREVFVLRPAEHEFVAVYVVFDRDGVLAQTVRDTYDLGAGLAAGLDANYPDGDGGDSVVSDASDDSGEGSEFDGDDDLDGGDDFDALDRL
ncbi:hypothetical protein C463_09449 [Halorubrum californiense DSM 19288]|uniref:Uncharacterized protein n=1 Tax=Halorubrum californiense DSM 19288 TaxID=1227465 RepID=M0E7W7_9EURY|nr:MULTISPECIES: DUF6663 family protein [Halorubrum]ELZ43880.1 hypothetical protein C463_09449 [Halorubrum californiense DSM 19288]TKX71239.1 hypothetical protein EXE40_07815 [Halorubrum sp. GN11GM_10-3_MGM]